MMWRIQWHKFNLVPFFHLADSAKERTCSIAVTSYATIYALVGHRNRSQKKIMFCISLCAIFFPFSSSACTVPSIEELPRENIKLLSDRKSFLMFASDWLDPCVNIRFQRTWKLKDLISNYDWRTGTINAEIVKWSVDGGRSNDVVAFNVPTGLVH